MTNIKHKLYRILDIEIFSIMDNELFESIYVFLRNIYLQEIFCNFNVYFRISFKLYQYNHDNRDISTVLMEFKNVLCNTHKIFTKGL